jgi:hypothetical protein
MAMSNTTRQRGQGAHKQKSTAPGRAPPALIPNWNDDYRELRLRGLLVKRFRQTAKNQVLICRAFQEQNWPHRIDDPLPPTEGIDSRRRLNDTIKSLNRHQINRLIHFMGDGTGTGICWELVP